VKIPFNARFIKYIKAKIPRGYRWFNSDPSVKAWVVSKNFQDELLHILDTLKIQYEFEQQQQQQEKVYVQAEIPPLLQALNILFEVSTIDELKVLRRSHTKRLHPDAGGDNDIFAEVNRAWDIVMEEKKNE
jgi:hypothetical protein